MIRLAAAALLAALTGCIAPPSDSPEACAFTRVADIPVRFRGNLPLVTVSVGGRDAELLLDTGAASSSLTQIAADRLGVVQDRARSYISSGLSAPVANYGVRLDRVKLGAAEFRDLTVAVRGAGLTGFGTPPPDGLLGNDMLGQHDVDFDLPNSRVTLYRRRDCPSGRPPWELAGKPLSRPPGAPSRNRLHLAVRLNDVAMVAFLDTGASTNVVDTAAARRAGVGAATLDAAPIAQINASTPGLVTARLVRLARLDVGEERLQGPVLLVTDLQREADVILGLPFMRRHRIWMAYGTQTLFIGPSVAPAPAP